ncbi:AzlC family ABC transporter permease [Salinibacillus xinjiangensis]|uniref:Branched-chain amino acid ABC transporter permease n=1 Tax=Salinibacillus xinjiangensis TaxID=1229268 RepID=A0A6G1X7N7_9BACI|nr:AzlC family ABC transporter permease [Salinibacillus xinjiangensis]MRG86890.1 branched-chain amino acid ABC transporter permease [Salinibacillus xinjiangensis]
MQANSAEKVSNVPTGAGAAFRSGLITGFPIFLGYLPIALAYGVLAAQSMTLLQLTAMSVLVFAGASQFMGAKMIGAGTGLLEVVVATFVLNFRHFVMSLSFMNKARPIPMRWKIPLSLGLTDETFAVSSLHGEEAKKPYGKVFFATVIVLAYSAWVGGSLVGGLLGELIPAQLSQSMNIALYAMFIGLLVPSVKKEWRVGLIAIISMLLNYALVNIHVNEGWAIVIATIIGGFFGIFLLKGDDEK